MAIALPPGFVGLVHPDRVWRTSWASRSSTPRVPSTPGTGEIMVNLINHDRDATVVIARGDRIAQLVVQRVEQADFVLVEELPRLHAGTQGHGSTGGHAALGAVGHPRATEEEW
ncbi:dUTP diphosphatase [Luedemannella flava]